MKKLMNLKHTSYRVSFFLVEKEKKTNKKIKRVKFPLSYERAGLHVVQLYGQVSQIKVSSHFEFDSRISPIF